LCLPSLTTAVFPALSLHDALPIYESDPLYDEALAYVTESRRASISSEQRKLKIGYNRAARLIETMEAAGVVSEAGHNGQREVLADRKSTRLNSSHVKISYAVFCLK